MAWTVSDAVKAGNDDRKNFALLEDRHDLSAPID